MASRRQLGMRIKSMTLPLRSGWRLSSFVLLGLVSAGMLVLGQWRPSLLLPVRVQVVDSLVPVLENMAEPARIIRSATFAWRQWIDMHTELTRLQAENARLANAENRALALEAENRELRAITQFHPEPPATGLTARVIANTGAPYAASMIVTAGAHDGVTRDMAAMTGDGLVGRVIEVGAWSARILLITDPDSRIPAMAQDGVTRAIVAGQGVSELEPLFLPADAALVPGTRFVTSGHGGLLPPNIPVGLVRDDGHGRSVIVPLADPSKVDYVRLVDFHLAGGEANRLQRALIDQP